ncbi:hypothetical protein KSF78_0006235 [Schistosoma japonicum]|nr:hypothetical protein KSF78_0006235 [Schistosoma japonicum]
MNLDNQKNISDAQKYHYSNDEIDGGCASNDNDNSNQRYDHDKGSTLTEVTVTKYQDNVCDTQLEEVVYQVSMKTTGNVVNPDLEEWISSSWLQDSSRQENEGCITPDSSYSAENKFKLQGNSSAHTSGSQNSNNTVIAKNQSLNRSHNQGRRSSKPPAPPPPFKQSFSAATSEGSDIL